MVKKTRVVKKTVIATAENTDISKHIKSASNAIKRRRVEQIAGSCEVDEASNIFAESSARSETAQKRPYVLFSRETWSPLYLYRTCQDLTAAAMRQSGSEGVGRREIGLTYGVDTCAKAGNRRVSAHIVNVMKMFPDHFGQYQKMEGKYRSIKYFWKVASGPGCFNELFKEWEEVTGTECPFKMGQVLKFPETTLSTLRISDVSLRRLIDIMRLLKEEHVIVTLHRLTKYIADKEHKFGYKYQIDKKSMLKCLTALQKKQFLNVYETIVIVDHISSKIAVICETDINGVNDPRVEAAIHAAIDKYNESGRIFPHGQARVLRKKQEETDTQTSANDLLPEEVVALDNDDCKSMTVEKRNAMLRLQSVRRTSIVHPSESSTNNDPVAEVEDLSENTTEEMDKSTPKIDEIRIKAEVDSSEKATSVPVFQDWLPNKKTSFRSSSLYGRQNKMVRCAIVHELAWHAVYGLQEGTSPTVWERFPPSKIVDHVKGTPVEKVPVYVDEESPFRFVPPLPRFVNLPHGWFLLQDFINILPLSVYVLLVNLNNRVEEIEPYLRDPILRHMLVLDLPSSIRFHLLQNRKAVRQVEYLLLTLCGFGLARLGPTSEAERLGNIETQYFYLTRGSFLRDTSTSERGYSCITPPAERYKRYDYKFESIDDVKLYWQHLRAISQSTPLAYRLDIPEEEKHSRKYMVGGFDKAHIIRSFEDFSETADPIPPNDGCAGFDSAFFAHLKRHWELNFSPLEYIHWFLSDWRRANENARSFIEQRVERLQKCWDSSMRSLLISESGVFKRVVNEERQTPSPSLFASGAKRLLARRANKRLSSRCSRKRRTERLLHNDDGGLRLRNRFTSTERNMLILLRAVGFFLNPVYRFWLDPTVLKEIMHEHVPESRGKCVKSLMAAGVREMVRPDKVAYLQLIVKSLSSFREMRVLRARLAAQPITDQVVKRRFFMEAFNKAKALLFKETENLPDCSENDQEFDKFLGRSNLLLSKQSQKHVIFPIRSLKPRNVQYIRHCVAYNFIIAMLLSEHDLADARVTNIIQQIGATTVKAVYEQLRVDGLITRPRFFSEDKKSKGQGLLSCYFRHFFVHRFHPELLQKINDAFDEMKQNSMPSDEDSPGTLALVSKCFYTNTVVDVTMSDDALSVFDNPSAGEQAGAVVNVTKQLRYLENSDLHIEKMALSVNASIAADLIVPSLEKLVETLKNIYALDAIKGACFDDFITKQPVNTRDLLRTVYNAVKGSGSVGASVEEIKAEINNTSAEVDHAVEELERNVQLILVGVDTIRYVIPAYSGCWLVAFGNRAYSPTPWFTVDGEVHLPTVRWIAEGVLFAIVHSPGLTIDDLKKRFAFVLQPRMLLEMIKFLDQCGCVNINKMTVQQTRLKTVYDVMAKKCDILYLSPTKDAIERFGRIFRGFASVMQLPAYP